MTHPPAFEDSNVDDRQFWLAVEKRRLGFFGAQKLLTTDEFDLLASILANTTRGPSFRGSLCLLWRGSKNSFGYGILRKRASIATGTTMVHRATYQLIFGSVPKRLDVDHLCHVRLCCNPFHGEPVTRRENTLRGVGMPAINAAAVACPRGHLYSGTNNRGDRFCHTCYAETARRSRSRKTGFVSRGPRSEQTTCPTGHSYDGVNERGYRICLSCRRESSRLAAQRRRDRGLCK